MSVQRAQGARGPLPVAAAPLRSHVSRGSAGWLLEQGGALSLSLSLSVVSRSLSLSLSLSLCAGRVRDLPALATIEYRVSRYPTRAITGK